MQTRQSSQSLYDQINHHRKEAKDCANNCPPSVAGANPRSKDVNIPDPVKHLGINRQNQILSETTSIQKIEIENFQASPSAGIVSNGQNLLTAEIKDTMADSDIDLLNNFSQVGLKATTCTDSELDDASGQAFRTEGSIFAEKVEIIPAQSPVDTEYLVGGIECKMFDERGGVFHSHNHGVNVIVPPGAIPSGTLAELKFAAMLVAPVKFTFVTPVSAIFWLCMEAILQKPIKICLPARFTNNRSSGLRFAKSLHFSPFRVIQQQMNVLEGGKFIPGQCYASIEVNHFCYYCITQDNLGLHDIPQNQYLLIAMKQHHPNPKDKTWNVHLCVVPLIRTCEKYLNSQYDHDWKPEVLQEIYFENGCSELQIEISADTFDNAAVVEVFSCMKIRKEDIDFHQYYTNGRQEDLKFRMEKKLYPPRRKTRVQAKHNSFFESSKTLDYCLVFDKKRIPGKIIIPCHNSDSYEISSSESDSSLQKNSFTSDCRSKSDDSLDCLPDEKEYVPGELQLRNLVLLTKKVEHKWYDLGIALSVPFEKLERIYDKYNDCPIKALVRVYRYWLADKNGLLPSRNKLVIALQKIDEYILSTNVAKDMPQGDDPHPAVSSDVSSQVMKEKVEKCMQPTLLNFVDLIPVLNKYHLLTTSDNYILTNTLIPPEERANALVYCMLPSKGSRAYEKFVKCLQEETEHLGHQELAKNILDGRTL